MVRSHRAPSPGKRDRARILALTFCLATGVGVIQAQALPHEPPAAPTEWSVLEVKPGAGEVCIVCDLPIHGENVVHLRYRGRHVTVGQPLIGEWEADPDRYFRKKQARAALFDEEAMRGERMGHGWLYFGLYMLFGTIVGGFTAYAAVARGLAPVPWFFAGVFSNVIALFLVLGKKGDLSLLPEGVPSGLRKVPLTRSPKFCPQCGAEHHPAARECPSCHAVLAPTIEAETTRLGRGGDHAQGS